MWPKGLDIGSLGTEILIISLPMGGGEGGQGTGILSGGWYLGQLVAIRQIKTGMHVSTLMVKMSPEWVCVRSVLPYSVPFYWMKRRVTCLFWPPILNKIYYLIGHLFCLGFVPFFLSSFGLGISWQGTGRNYGQTDRYVETMGSAKYGGGFYFK